MWKINNKINFGAQSSKKLHVIVFQADKLVAIWKKFVW